MKIEPVLTAEEFKKAREEVDENDLNDYDLVHEIRDKYPLREFVLMVVEGQFTHPSGEHNLITVGETAHSVAEDYARDLIPVGEISEEARTKFERELSSDIKIHSEELYKYVHDEAQEVETISKLQDLLESSFEELDLPEKY